MPQLKLGGYYRPIPCEGIDISWCNRPFLCRLGIHRPIKTLMAQTLTALALTDNSENANKKGCLRCPYFWVIK